MATQPSLLFFDTDCLLQLMIAGVNHPIAKHIKDSYGITSVVVPEVEIEVTRSRKFGNQFEANFRKMQNSGLITVIDDSNYTSLVNQDASIQQAAAGVSHSHIQAEGKRYNLRSDLGEAYTHATAVCLGQPAASNDFSALKALDAAGEALPSPVMRTFDLVVFARQTNALTDQQCDGIRKALANNKEWVPRAFKNTSFKKGLSSFAPRLIDSSHPRIGATANPKNIRPFAAPLVLK